MAFSHGKKGNFQSQDSAGVTFRDISAFLTDVGYPRTTDTAETSGLGSNDKTYVVGLRDARITFAGHWDPTATTGPDAVLSSILGLDTPIPQYKYSPAGLGVGNIQYQGSYILTSYEVDSPIGDRVNFSAEGQNTGAVTRTTL